MSRAAAIALGASMAIASFPACARASGQTLHIQNGQASVYSRAFGGRRTASGERFSTQSNIAASKTLPIGTTARVINLETGRAATVRILDRGPFVRGRILDLSPATASEIGIDRKGLARVSVEPLSGPSAGWRAASHRHPT